MLRKAVIYALQLLFKHVQGKKPAEIFSKIYSGVCYEDFPLSEQGNILFIQEMSQGNLQKSTFLCCLENKIPEIITHLDFHHYLSCIKCGVFKHIYLKFKILNVLLLTFDEVGILSNEPLEEGILPAPS